MGTMLITRNYLVKLKFAVWVVPSINVTCNWRHELAHPLSVFQT
jgi:hypothetical protein